MIEKIERSSGKIIGFLLSGRLHDEDYNIFVPQLESVIEQEGKTRLLAHFHDFHGWDLHAAWDDMKFALKHYGDVELIALVGEREWQEWMAKICKPFTRARVRYFDSSEIEKTWEWLREEHKGERKGETDG